MTMALDESRVSLGVGVPERRPSASSETYLGLAIHSLSLGGRPPDGKALRAGPSV